MRPMTFYRLFINTYFSIYSLFISCLVFSGQLNLYADKFILRIRVKSTTVRTIFSRAINFAVMFFIAILW